MFKEFQNKPIKHAENILFGFMGKHDYFIREQEFKKSKRAEIRMITSYINVPEYNINIHPAMKYFKCGELEQLYIALNTKTGKVLAEDSSIHDLLTRHFRKDIENANLTCNIHIEYDEAL